MSGLVLGMPPRLSVMSIQRLWDGLCFGTSTSSLLNNH